MVKISKELIRFFERFEDVVENRSNYLSAREILQINKKIFQDSSNCNDCYLNVFRVFDEALFDGMLLKCLKKYNFDLIFKCGKIRRDIFAITGQTTLKNRMFKVQINLPGRSEIKPAKKHVGFKVCKLFDNSCTIYLLEHEFVHILEIFLRCVLHVDAGFSENDKENNMFRVLLNILFDHGTDTNVL